MSLKPWKILGSKYLHKTNAGAVRIDQCEVYNGTVFEPYVVECGTRVIEVSLIPFDALVALVKAGNLPQALHVSTLFFALAYLERVS